MSFIESHDLSPDAGMWTARHVAAFLKCSVSYVYKAAERGSLPSQRVGRMLRFDPVAVRTFVSDGPRATQES